MAGILFTTRGVGGAPPPTLCLRPVRYERDMPLVKHLGLFGPLHARHLAQHGGADDALFHDAADLVFEGPTWRSSPALPRPCCATAATTTSPPR
ncbi:hypothetical protein [Streptomyces sp. enrichment culture]|uniref:hypothetical protein n=1 Tax=Streptomyces sp. enrichment culture TaxID=1795815 RepID=UPI003F570B2F